MPNKSKTAKGGKKRRIKSYVKSIRYTVYKDSFNDPKAGISPLFEFEVKLINPDLKRLVSLPEFTSKYEVK